MTTNTKCQAIGGVENCTSPNCPEKKAAVEQLYTDFIAQRSKILGATPVAPIYGGVDDGLRSNKSAFEPKTMRPQAPEPVSDDEEVWEDNAWDRPNPVNTPEKFGMEMFAEISLPAADWSFYDAAILKNEKGYYLSTDSGCSCPTPWENHTIDDFTGPMTAEQAAEELQSLHDTCDTSDMSEYTRNDVRQAVVKLRAQKFMAEHPDVHPSLVEEMFAPE